MLEEQKEWLDIRPSQEGHTSLIENAYLSTTKPDKHFRRICRRTFTLHSVESPCSRIPIWPNEDEFQSSHLPSGIPEWLTYNFHHKHYKLPEYLTKGLASDGGKVSLMDEFWDRLKANGKPGQKNKVTFLIGGVGSGKSTLISNIVCKYGVTLVRDHNVVLIRFDIDKKLNHNLPPKHYEKVVFINYLFDRIVNVYSDLFPDKVLASNIYDKFGINEKSEPAVCRNGLTNLIKHLYETTKMTPTLIIDNFDFLYHIYDRAAFIEQAISDEQDESVKLLFKERSRCYEMIQCIITIFYDTSYALAELGANILIVLRSDSLTHFLANRVDLSPPDPRSFTYRIQIPPMDEVINTHLGLMADAFNRWPKVTLRKIYLEAIENIQPMKESLPVKTKKNLHGDLIAIARQWYRQIIDHYGRYVWLPVSIIDKDEKEVVTARFSDQYTPGIISFVQNGNRLFTQFESEFPNVYLINGEKKQEKNLVLSSLCKPHRHTYWLKRLILEYITQMKRLGRTVSPESIYRVFCNPKDNVFCYEDYIVRLVLGSLSQVEKCNCLELKYVLGPRSFDVEEIYLTDRAWRLMGYLDHGKKEAKNVFIDTFTYLQMVVDDYLLPLPISLFDEFSFKSGRDYGYLAAPAEIYGVETFKMIEYKLRLVFYFIEILRISYKYEKLIFKNTFQRLERAINIPTVEEIEKRVIESIAPIQNFFRKHYKPSFDYKNYIPNKKDYIKLLECEIEKIYGAPSV